MCYISTTTSLFPLRLLQPPRFCHFQVNDNVQRFSCMQMSSRRGNSSVVKHQQTWGPGFDSWLLHPTTQGYKSWGACQMRCM